MARLAAGETAVFDALYLQYYDRLLRFALRFVSRIDIAEDVVHDVFAALWQNQNTPSIHTGLTAYLYGAVRNRALHVHRHETRVERHGIDAGIVGLAMGHSPDDPAHHAEANDLITRVEHAIAHLPERQRTAITLHVSDNLTYDEIGATLGVSKVAVHHLIQKARATIRSKLGLT